jgi:hypothetical protein
MTEKQEARPPRKRRRTMRSRSVSELLQRVGAETEANRPNDDDDEAPPMTMRERLARSLWDRALAGDHNAAKTVLEYTEGSPGKGRDGASMAPTSGRLTFVFEEFVAEQQALDCGSSASDGAPVERASCACAPHSR